MAAFHGAPPVRLVTSLLMYKPWVPRPMRFWLVIVFVLFYQFTGGVYLAAITQIQGELAYISEDVTMASYCSLIGLNIIFPMLFRWKFGLFTRQMWFVSSLGCLGCAVAAMYVQAAWLFWAVCFLAGYFKMMGMFACISTIQLNMTPTRNFGVFLPVIYLFVLGAMRLSDITVTWLAWWWNWKLIYCVIVVMMLFIDAIVYYLMKPDHRSGPYVPLKGIDWAGQLLWSLTCMAGAWVFNFGEHYEWWTSTEIWTGTWVFVLLLGATLWRMFTAPQPFITPEAFRGRPMTWFLWLVLAGVAFFGGLAHYVQPIFVNGVLGYDSINAIDLNWPQLAGIVMGAILAFTGLVKLKWSIRVYLMVNMSLFMVYLVTMYFVSVPTVTKEILYVPVFFLAMGEVMMETGATYALSQRTPFPVFFMNITIIGFVRCGLGTAAAAGLVEHLFAVKAADYGLLQAVRECFGLGCWVGVVLLAVILASRFKAVPAQLLPKISTSFRLLMHREGHAAKNFVSVRKGA